MPKKRERCFHVFTATRVCKAVRNLPRKGGGGKGVSIWLSGGLGSGPRVLVDDRGFSSATLNLQFIASFIAVYLALAYFGSEVYLQWESPKGF